VNHEAAYHAAMKEAKRYRAHLVMASHHSREANRADLAINRLRPALTPEATALIERIIEGDTTLFGDELKASQPAEEHA
jgi:hypothetical protein